MANYFYFTISIIALLVHSMMNYDHFQERPDAEQTPDRKYQFYLKSVFFYLIAEAFRAVFTEIGNIPLLVLDTIAIYIFMAISVVCGCQYVAKYLGLSGTGEKILRVFGNVFFAVDAIGLIVNHFIPIFFRIEKDMSYAPGRYRYVVFGILILLYLMLTFYGHSVAVHSEGHDKIRSRAVCMYSALTVVFIVLQTFFPTFPMYTIGLLLGNCYFHVFIREDERNEYRKRLQSVNEELRRVNEIQESQIEEITELNASLQQKQAMLEEAAAEQEAQIEEITALNTNLQEQQTMLEESTSEQEAQIEEITALNDELENRRSEVEQVLVDLAEQNDIIANVGLGIWHIYIKDDEKCRLRGNRKMLELLGISDNELTEEELYDFWISRVAPESMPSVDRSVQEILSGLFSENTYQWNHPTKGLIYVRCGGTMTTLEDGTKVLRGCHSDVTNIVLDEQNKKRELFEARELAEIASHSKSMFLSNMSHDIRTPMNAILGFTELIEKEKNNPEVISEYIKKIRGSGDYLLTIINNILDMARIDSGSVGVDDDFMDLSDEEASVAPIFEALIKEKKIHFTAQTTVQHFYILGDYAKTRQITVNLLSNAIKYTPEGGSVRMEMNELPCDREGYANYELVVSDSGIGMSEEFIEHIFDYFSRERNTTESKVIGTGLGMSIVKKLVDLLGGTIQIESGLGVGSTIKVTIPHRIIDNPEEYIKEEKESRVNSDILKGKRILLAEDNDLNAEIAKAVLEELGCIVEHAWDGVECVDMLGRSDAGYYDLILMDIQMPNVDGYSATEKIRNMADSVKSQIPIIAMTANAFEEDKQSAYAAGMNGHIAKPFRVGDLTESIGSVFE